MLTVVSSDHEFRGALSSSSSSFHCATLDTSIHFSGCQSPSRSHRDNKSSHGGSWDKWGVVSVRDTLGYKGQRT